MFFFSNIWCYVEHLNYTYVKIYEIRPIQENNFPIHISVALYTYMFTFLQKILCKFENNVILWMH